MRAPIAISVLAFGALAASGAMANDHGCETVRTSIVTTFIPCPAEFPSPVGICTQGTIESGPLKGSTLFRALTLVPGPSDTMLYTGEILVTSKHGTLTLNDFGVLDAATGRFFETQVVVAGTGKFEHATGLLTSQGLETATGFDGTLDGAVCRDGNAGHGEPRR